MCDIVYVQKIENLDLDLSSIKLQGRKAVAGKKSSRRDLKKDNEKVRDLEIELFFTGKDRIQTGFSNGLEIHLRYVKLKLPKGMIT